MYRILISFVGIAALTTILGCGKASEQQAEEPAEPAETMAQSAGMVPLVPVYPDPQFQGTPVPVKLSNLEKPGTKPPQVMIAEGSVNLAADKAVSGSDEFPIIGELEFVTDSDKEGVEGSYVELGPDVQHVQIDLGQKSEIYAVLVWHYHNQARAYHDVIVQVSDDADFASGVKTIYNNDHDNSSGMGVGTDPAYIETNQGRVIDAKGVEGRYVRLYSRGNTANDMNHYVEVEVYGKPVE